LPNGLAPLKKLLARPSWKIRLRKMALMLVGVLPVWPHASSWGYGPSGAVGLVVLILVILLVMGRI